MIRLDTLAQLRRFGMVGVVATGTHYAVALAVSLVLSAYLANIAGYVCALGVSYVGHQRLTFRVEPDMVRHKRQLPRFVVASLSALAVSQAALFVLRWLALPAHAALIAAVVTVPPVTYGLSRAWVFR
jgi:putative flippase GtrA